MSTQANIGDNFFSYPSHYVHIVIDLEKKFIITKDPMGINKSMQKSVSKIRMFVAKAFGIGYKFVMDDKKEEEIYFGQADMQRKKFVENEVKTLKKNKNITASSFNHMNSPQHKYPQQIDSFNCGVLALWYNLILSQREGLYCG